MGTRSYLLMKIQPVYTARSIGVRKMPHEAPRTRSPILCARSDLKKAIGATPWTLRRDRNTPKYSGSTQMILQRHWKRFQVRSPLDHKHCSVTALPLPIHYDWWYGGGCEDLVVCLSLTAEPLGGADRLYLFSIEHRHYSSYFGGMHRHGVHCNSALTKHSQLLYRVRHRASRSSSVNAEVKVSSASKP